MLNLVVSFLSLWKSFVKEFGILGLKSPSMLLAELDKHSGGSWEEQNGEKHGQWRLERRIELYCMCVYECVCACMCVCMHVCVNECVYVCIC